MWESSYLAFVFVHSDSFDFLKLILRYRIKVFESLVCDEVESCLCGENWGRRAGMICCRGEAVNLALSCWSPRITPEKLKLRVRQMRNNDQGLKQDGTACCVPLGILHTPVRNLNNHLDI